MCQLFETILVKSNRLVNLEYHNARVNESRRTLFHSADKWDLAELISLPVLDASVVYKCRFMYSKKVDHIEFLTYSPRIINNLYLVSVIELDYSFKYVNRDRIEKLRKSRTENPDEDILIVKDGCISDTSYANIAFHNGAFWVTPDTPLLKGTKRASYLQNGKLVEKRITPDNLVQYQKARLINAMLDLETGGEIRIENIIREI
jgi:4-amino-4-deoxychorismate lyase